MLVKINSILKIDCRSILMIIKLLMKHKLVFSQKRELLTTFVLRILTEKYQSLNCKLYACFVDFEKAFDSVIHNIMFYKLCSANISGLFYSVLKNMYSDKYSHIKVGDSLSEQVAQNIGLRQGNHLSPYLFKQFLHNIPSYFDASTDQVILENVSFSCLMYAGDLVLLSTTEKKDCRVV